ncbi:hypothetical protein IJT93_06235 [bacterium]|nr:hypothetical protein [bacterium]
MSEKLKITSKEELEFVYNFMILDDDWLNRPILKTPEERKQYEENMHRRKMEIIKKNYNICIEDDK